MGQVVKVYWPVAYAVLNYYRLLNCPTWPVRLQMFVTGQVKSDSLDADTAHKTCEKADNDQSYSSIYIKYLLVLRQLQKI